MSREGKEGVGDEKMRMVTGWGRRCGRRGEGLEGRRDLTFKGLTMVTVSMVDVGAIILMMDIHLHFQARQG